MSRINFQPRSRQVKLNYLVCRGKMETKQLFFEARAKIVWGELAATVRSFLVANGISEVEADAKIKEFLVERNAEIRRIGLRKVVIGVVLLTVSGFFLFIEFKNQYVGYSTTRSGRALGMMLLAAIYGLWKLVDGIIDLARPQSEEGSIPDMLE